MIHSLTSYILFHVLFTYIQCSKVFCKVHKLHRNMLLYITIYPCQICKRILNLVSQMYNEKVLRRCRLYSSERIVCFINRTKQERRRKHPSHRHDDIISWLHLNKFRIFLYSVWELVPMEDSSGHVIWNKMWCIFRLKEDFSCCSLRRLYFRGNLIRNYSTVNVLDLLELRAYYRKYIEVVYWNYVKVNYWNQSWLKCISLEK